MSKLVFSVFCCRPVSFHVFSLWCCSFRTSDSTVSTAILTSRRFVLVATRVAFSFFSRTCWSLRTWDSTASSGLPVYFQVSFFVCVTLASVSLQDSNRIVWDYSLFLKLSLFISFRLLFLLGLRQSEHQFCHVGGVDMWRSGSWFVQSALVGWLTDWEHSLVAYFIWTSRSSWVTAAFGGAPGNYFWFFVEYFSLFIGFSRKKEVLPRVGCTEKRMYRNYPWY